MSRRRAGALAGCLVAAALLTGCSGSDDPAPAPETTTPAPQTPPPISPRDTVPLPSGSTLPKSLPPTPSPSPSGGLPIPIPSAPEN